MRDYEFRRLRASRQFRNTTAKCSVQNIALQCPLRAGTVLVGPTSVENSVPTCTWDASYDRCWYVQYFDHTGKRRAVSTGTTFYAEAKKIGDKLAAEAAIRRHYVIDQREEAIALQLARPLSEHFADYRAKLKTAGRSDCHVRDTLIIHSLRVRQDRQETARTSVSTSRVTLLMIYSGTLHPSQARRPHDVVF